MNEQETKDYMKSLAITMLSCGTIGLAGGLAVKRCVLPKCTRFEKGVVSLGTIIFMSCLPLDDMMRRLHEQLGIKYYKANLAIGIDIDEPEETED